MSGFLYYLAVAAESALSVVGIRAPYEQPHYTVTGQLPGEVEIRAYAARTAVETTMRDANDSEAFGRLFRYITGANRDARRVAMTIPVEQTSQRIAMTIPVELGGDQAMRFFLPQAVVQAGPPVPTDPAVRIVTLPPQNFAVLRFSGTINEASRATYEAALLAALSDAHRQPTGPASLLSYDPPFAIPFLRRNEIAAPIE